MKILQAPRPDDLVAVLNRLLSPQKRLFVALSDFRLFGKFADHSFTKKAELLNLQSETYDMIVADLPLGMRRPSPEIRELPQRIRENWGYIYLCAQMLAERGWLIANIEPGFSSGEWNDLLTLLKNQGVYQTAALEFTGEHYQGTMLPVMIGVFARIKPEKLFVAGIDATTSLDILGENLVSGQFGQTLSDGIGILPDQFRRVSQIKAAREIEALEAQYKRYKRKILVPEIAKSANVFVCKQNGCFETHERAIYIPKVGVARVTSDVSKLESRHHNYYQVVVSDVDVLPEYLAVFFRSHLGALILSSVRDEGAVIPRINKAALEQIVVPVPSKDDQSMIILAYQRLSDLEGAVSLLQNDLSLNPSSAPKVVEQAETMLQQVNRLSASDEILSLIRHGESKVLEFKQTLSGNRNAGAKEKFLEEAVLKTIVAFLNSQGGTLLVGVADDGQVTGLRGELDAHHAGSRDNLLKHFKNLFRSNVGETFYPHINYDIHAVNGELVLRVDCQASDKEAFFRSEDFYVRTNPATDLLKGQKMIEYIRTRFRAQVFGQS
jgi:hypothetical protein